MSKYLMEQERKAIRLVEERGVAAFPYRTVCNEIIGYCKKVAVGMKPGDERTVSIPSAISNKIDFINNLIINIEIKDGEDYAHITGGGKVELQIDDKIVNGKYSSGIITIYGFSYCGVLYERTILNSLYHELNHFYEAWKELTKTGSMGLYASQANKGQVKVNIFDDERYNLWLTELCYRLYAESELNALISSVYGDLESFDSKRENFSKDIEKTQAYWLYKNLCKFLPCVMNEFKKEPGLIFYFYKTLNYYGIHLNSYTKDALGLMKEFNRRTKYLLKCLIRGIGRAASLYYDSREVPKDKKTITMK
jgi:hypothetical protein